MLAIRLQEDLKSQMEMPVSPVTFLELEMTGWLKHKNSHLLPQILVL